MLKVFLLPSLIKNVVSLYIPWLVAQKKTDSNSIANVCDLGSECYDPHHS